MNIYIYIYVWMFPKIVVPQNGWFIMEHLIKVDDLGVLLFLETPIYIYINTFYIIHFLTYKLHPKKVRTGLENPFKNDPNISIVKGDARDPLMVSGTHTIPIPFPYL